MDSMMVDGWMDGWMDGWRMDGWRMDGWDVLNMVSDIKTGCKIYVI